MNNFSKSQPYNIDCPNEIWFYQLSGSSDLISSNFKVTLNSGESCFIPNGSNISHIPSNDASGIFLFCYIIQLKGVWIVYR